MKTIRFAQLPDGKLITFAGLIEDFLFNDLGLPFSSMDCNGEFHPGTKLNAIAKELYSRRYSNVFKLKKEDWCCINKHNENNFEFIDQMIKQQMTTRKAVHNGDKLDCYSFDFLNAVIQYIAMSERISIVEMFGVVAVPIEFMPVLTAKEWAKPVTSASPLFSMTKQEEEEIYGTVISTFAEPEQQVIREYMERCKNTYDARKRAREKEKSNGKT